MASDNKKYYWLKLKEDFFKDKAIKKMRRIAGGDTYTIIYLKLMLLGLRDEGKLYFEGVEDTFAEEIALELDEDVDNVKMTMMYLMKMGLIQEVSEAELFLTRLPECVGKETSKAELMRKKRARDKALGLGDGNNVTAALPPVTESYTEIEIEKEIELETDIEKEKEKELKKEKKSMIYKEIVDYLNEKTGSAYKSTTKKTQELIDARLNEDFTVEDFKTVIDKKCIDWIGTEYAKFLVPTTLFSNKFEGYLNAKVYTRKQVGASGIEIKKSASDEEDVLSGIL